MTRKGKVRKPGMEGGRDFFTWMKTDGGVESLWEKRT